MGPVEVSDFSKQLFGGYFIDDQFLNPREQLDGPSTDLFGGDPLSCATMGAICTSSSVCPAGSSVGKHGKEGGRDCLTGTCCGSAQQLWAQEGVLVIDVPSSSPSDIPDSPSDADVIEVRLATEFKLVLKSLGLGRNAASKYRIPTLTPAQQLIAGERPKPTSRLNGTNSGILDTVL
jgi:hypothetical protein